MLRGEHRIQMSNQIDGVFCIVISQYVVTPRLILFNDIMVRQQRGEVVKNHLRYTIRPLLVIRMAILIT